MSINLNINIKNNYKKTYKKALLFKKNRKKNVFLLKRNS
jgi:hypothetical protein